MKNQISALSDSFPCPDELSKKNKKQKNKNWFGVGGSWLKYLLLIPLILLTIPFVFYLFHKIICCITKCMTGPPMKMMTRLEAVDQTHSLIYDQ